MRDFGHRFFISPEAYAEVAKALGETRREAALRTLPRMPRLFLFDVRSNLTGDEAAAKNDFAAGHVPGARFLSFESFFAGERTGTNGRHPWPDIAALREKLLAIGLMPQDRLVFLDAGAMNFAARALLCARAAGFTEGAVLDGGYALWAKLGMPIETGEGECLVANTSAEETTNNPYVPHAGPICLTLDEVKTCLLTPNAHERLILLDARPRKRWLGDEPSDVALDGACGHIPGSINRAASENLDVFGRMKASERLRLEFETLFAQAGIPLASIVEKGAIVHSCGSGVAACLNILAMDRAGLVDADRARLYPGSWSEWARHPELPVARGET